MVARESARIVHVSQEIADQATALYFRPPLQYNKWAVNIAAVVLVWIGWACVVVACVSFTLLPLFLIGDWLSSLLFDDFDINSTYYMFKAAAYDAKYGTGPPGHVTGGYPSTSSDALATPHAPRDSSSTLPTQQFGGAGKDKFAIPTTTTTATGGRVHKDGQGLSGVELTTGEFHQQQQQEQYGGAGADRRV
jgi:hypothetical protein